MLQTSKEFFSELARRTGKTQVECRQFWEESLDLIYEQSAKSDKLTTILPGLGKVIAKVDPISIRRNPRTGAQVITPATRRVRIKLFPTSVDRFNQGFNTKKVSK